MVPDRELEAYAESAMLSDEVEGFIEGKLGLKEVSGDFFDDETGD